MATPEGVFPKQGADPLYFSEVNGFANSRQMIGSLNVINVASGTAQQNIGSIVVGAGSIPYPTVNLWIDWQLTTSSNASTVFATISGLGNNTQIFLGSATSTAVGTTKAAIYRSDNANATFYTSQYYPTISNGLLTSLISTPAGSGVNATSGLVVSFQVQNSNVSNTVFRYANLYWERA